MQACRSEKKYLSIVLTGFISGFPSSPTVIAGLTGRSFTKGTSSRYVPDVRVSLQVPWQAA